MRLILLNQCICASSYIRIVRYIPDSEYNLGTTYDKNMVWGELLAYIHSCNPEPYSRISENCGFSILLLRPLPRPSLLLFFSISPSPAVYGTAKMSNCDADVCDCLRSLRHAMESHFFFLSPFCTVSFFFVSPGSPFLH